MMMTITARIENMTYGFIIGAFVGWTVSMITILSLTIPKDVANERILHSYCREHSGKLVNINGANNQICVRNNNLNDQVVMPDYYRIR